jgi:hypothetical protein
MPKPTRWERKYRLRRQFDGIVLKFRADALQALPPLDRWRYFVKQGKAQVQELVGLYISLKNLQRAALASLPPDTLIADDLALLIEDVLWAARKLKVVASTGTKVIRGELGEGAFTEAMRDVEGALARLEVHSRDSILGLAETRAAAVGAGITSTYDRNNEARREAAEEDRANIRAAFESERAKGKGVCDAYRALNKAHGWSESSIKRALGKKK